MLSNNDANVVARSQQTKDLGIPMGAVWHEYRDICAQYDVAVFSAVLQKVGVPSLVS